MKNFIIYKNNNQKLPQNVERQLNKTTFKMNSVVLNVQLSEICPLLQEWKVQTLISGIQKHDEESLVESQIITYLTATKFPMLTYIDLSRNCIQSIENINQVWMPSLEILNMGQNDIINIDTCRKSFWPQLRSIDIGGNKINEGYRLCEFLCKQDINIEWETDNEQCFDISWIAKVEGKQLKKICIDSEERIENYKCAFILFTAKKFVQLEQ